MANESKKNFNAMLQDSKDMPKIQTVTDPKTIEKYGGTRMYFAPPVDYDKNPDLHTGYKSSKIVTTLNFGVGSQWRADTNRADVHHGIKTRNYHQHRSF